MQFDAVSQTDSASPESPAGGGVAGSAIAHVQICTAAKAAASAAACYVLLITCRYAADANAAAAVASIPAVAADAGSTQLTDSMQQQAHCIESKIRQTLPMLLQL